MSDVESFIRFCESEFGQAVMDREADYVRDHLSSNEQNLDVGCGIGSLEERLREIEMVGLDIDHMMLREARNRTSDPLVAGDARTLPIAQNTLKGVVTIATLEFIPEVDRVLEEVKRVLKPSGKFLALILNTRSKYVRKNLNRDDSYFQEMVHRDSDALAQRIGRKFETETEYFLGIENKRVFETQSPGKAAVLAVRGIPST